MTMHPPNLGQEKGDEGIFMHQSGEWHRRACKINGGTKNQWIKRDATPEETLSRKFHEPDDEGTNDADFGEGREDQTRADGFLFHTKIVPYTWEKKQSRANSANRKTGQAF